MDSMRNLRGSLPRSASNSRQTAPPADLLQTFKQAALSVTNLYRRAADEMEIERAAGYQDAVYELLSFLDREHIGLGDGEGWRIRQWATEKQQQGPERARSEGEDVDEARDPSPVLDPEPPVVAESSPVRELERIASPEISPVIRHAVPTPQPPQPPQSENFTFQAAHPYPEYAMDSTSVPPEQPQNGRPQHTRPGSTSRNHRRPSHAPQHQRQNHRHSRTLGPGAGTKRRDYFGDLFGLGSLDHKDPFGGHNSKRPRGI